MCWLRIGVCDRCEGGRRVGEVFNLVSITEAALLCAETAALSEGNGEVGGGWLWGLVGRAESTLLGERAGRCLANGVVLKTLVCDNGLGGQASVVEPFVESVNGLVNVLLGEAKRFAGETDLVDEVADFKGTEPHELVDFVN